MYSASDSYKLHYTCTKSMKHCRCVRAVVLGKLRSAWFLFHTLLAAERGRVRERETFKASDKTRVALCSRTAHKALCVLDFNWLLLDIFADIVPLFNYVLV